MYLTISKKFELSLSYRWHNPAWSDERNRSFFGDMAGGVYGFGGNFTAYFVFTGEVDRDTGMVINVTIIKERINKLLAQRYDHKYLNVDTPPFDRIVPSPENVALYLIEDARPLFAGESADLVACHLETSPTAGATAYANGRVERHVGLEFSAARRTWSPHLSEEENTRLFGLASSPAGHGHYYYLRATLGGDVDEESGMVAPPSETDRAMRSLHKLLDHRNLNVDVPELDGLPMTTEALSGFVYERLRNRVPIDRIRLWENPWFFTECLGPSEFLMGVKTTFRAAHRLHSPTLSDQDNRTIYGKCDNPSGHGHQYIVEATIDGPLDELSGTLFPLDDLLNAVDSALTPWKYKHLDLDSNDFVDRPSTGENIVEVLWPRIEDRLARPLHRLRLWETPNNRFTLRRGPVR